MLREFEAWILAFSAGSGYDQRQLFWNAWTEYYNAFQSWKDQDSRKIVDGMIAHFMELERLWLSVKDQVHADIEWAPRITEHQQQLHRKLAKFGKKALQQLKSEREALRIELEVDEIDMLISGQDLSTSPETFPSVSRSPSRRGDSVSPTRKPQPTKPISESDQEVAPTPSAASGSPSPLRAPVNQATPTPMDGADPQLASFGFGSQLTNAQLAHELVMDPDFKLEAPKRSALEEQIRAIAKKAFFDSVRQEFSEGKFGQHVPAFIAQIREVCESVCRAGF